MCPGNRGKISAVALPVTDSFWEDLGAGAFDHLGAGRLVSQMDFLEDWTSWEMHPHGEEFIYLLGGSVDFVVSANGVETTTSLVSPGTFLIVPRGAWHTANVHERSSMLFITPGEGTQHRHR